MAASPPTHIPDPQDSQARGTPPPPTAATADSSSAANSSLAGEPPVKKENYNLYDCDVSALRANIFIDDTDSKPNWLITFADLITLVLCFFILLFVFSQIDLKKFQAMALSLSNALGSKTIIYLPSPLGTVRTNIEPQPNASDKFNATLADAEQLSKLLAAEIQQQKLDIQVSEQLIIIHILQNGSFETGSATLNKEFPSTAKKIRDALVAIPGDITVAGHTDNQPITGGTFRSNWELSGARAFSVMNELLKDNVLPENRFVLKGYADTKPRLPNTSASNREKNRRVEIIIDQQNA